MNMPVVFHGVASKLAKLPQGWCYFGNFFSIQVVENLSFKVLILIQMS